MKYEVTSVFVAFSMLCMTSCDRPECNNENPIFENNEPSSSLYKDELVRKLNNIDQDKLTYWLQKYEDKGGEESLYFHIQGDSLCAILHLTMSHWNKSENVRENKGIGRRGAEFTNLKFDIIHDSTSTKFIYQTYDRLID